MSDPFACPLRMRPTDEDGRCCCNWSTFAESFVYGWRRTPGLDRPPTLKQWQAARRTWRHGNTGWEAAQIALADQKRAAELGRSVGP